VIVKSIDVFSADSDEVISPPPNQHHQQDATLFLEKLAESHPLANKSRLIALIGHWRGLVFTPDRRQTA
jgi:hypothetical protein